MNAHMSSAKRVPKPSHAHEAAVVDKALLGTSGQLPFAQTSARTCERDSLEREIGARRIRKYESTESTTHLQVGCGQKRLGQLFFNHCLWFCVARAVKICVQRFFNRSSVYFGNKI